MFNNSFPASFTRFGWCPSTEWVCWEPQLLVHPSERAPPGKGRLQGFPGFPCLSHRSTSFPQNSKDFVTPGRYFQTRLSKYKMSEPFTQTAAKEWRKWGTFSPGVTQVFPGKDRQEFARSGWKACKGHAEPLWSSLSAHFPFFPSQGSLPPATNPIFACAWPFCAG